MRPGSKEMESTGTEGVGGSKFTVKVSVLEMIYGDAASLKK